MVQRDQIRLCPPSTSHQGGVDRRREAGIVELDREIFAVLLASLLPGGAELRLAGEDPEVGGLVVALLVGPQDRSLDVEGEGLDRTGVAVALSGEGADGGHVSLSFASGHACRGLDGDRQTEVRAARRESEASPRSEAKDRDERLSCFARKAVRPGMKVAEAVAPADRASVRSASSRGRAGWREKDARRWPPPHLLHRRQRTNGRAHPLGRPGSGRHREDLLNVKAPCGQGPQQFGFGSLKIEPGRAILGP